VFTHIVYSHWGITRYGQVESHKSQKIGFARKIKNDGRSDADATARVLVREGYARTSTNRIAAVAGVSIGSLYQYFPNKESLVAALVARHNREILALLENAMQECASDDLNSALRELIAP
jgi:AcrR family transcriptional regulator